MGIGRGSREIVVSVKALASFEMTVTMRKL